MKADIKLLVHLVW